MLGATTTPEEVASANGGDRKYRSGRLRLICQVFNTACPSLFRRVRGWPTHPGLIEAKVTADIRPDNLSVNGSKLRGGDGAAIVVVRPR